MFNIELGSPEVNMVEMELGGGRRAEMTSGQPILACSGLVWNIIKTAMAGSVCV
jgi:hypothetical protein